MTQGSSQSFDLLHEKVRHWVWQQNWSELRDIQEEAIRVLLPRDRDVVISSATASGKTEAAYLPIASHLASRTDSGLGVLNVSPLKALINDQYDRLLDLFENIECPVFRWHGDVGASPKKRLMADPQGVLLITPESLEAVFVRQGPAVQKLFQGLRYIVVDELHAFIGSERGRQLQSLLHRVEDAAGQRVPRVALSATLGDLSLAADFLRPHEGAQVHQIVSQLGQREVKIQIRGYREDAVPSAPPEANEDMVSSDVEAIQSHLYKTMRGGRHIVFANRRADVELFSDGLRRKCEDRGVPNEFWPHHGSLSKSIREDTEAALKDGNRPVTVLATSTLELGIDVGSVESIGQIGSPHSVASIRQRLGRSGRRGEPAVLRVYVSEPQVVARTALPDRIRADLVQSVAVIRLLVERWCEAPRPGALHLSTLVQQILSVIAERGGVRADVLFDLLCVRGPFQSVTPAMLGQLLRDLARHDLVQQLHSNELVLGLDGERLVNHYDFYSAFTSPEEYRLIAVGRTLGTMPVVFPLIENNYLIFAGRRWKILRVDAQQKVAELEPSPGGRTPRFGGGGALVDTRIRTEMRAVYGLTGRPAFLDPTAGDLLDEARDEFRRMGLVSTDIIPAGPDVLLFPWLGDRPMATLALLLSSEGIRASIEPPAIRIEKTTTGEIEAIFANWSSVQARDAVSLASLVPNKYTEKHHQYLSEDLLSLDYASSRLDLLGVEEWLTARRGVAGRDEP